MVDSTTQTLCCLIQRFVSAHLNIIPEKLNEAHNNIAESQEHLIHQFMEAIGVLNLPNFIKWGDLSIKPLHQTGRPPRRERIGATWAMLIVRSRHLWIIL